MLSLTQRLKIIFVLSFRNRNENIEVLLITCSLCERRKTNRAFERHLEISTECCCWAIHCESHLHCVKSNLMNDIDKVSSDACLLRVWCVNASAKNGDELQTINSWVNIDIAHFVCENVLTHFLRLHFYVGKNWIFYTCSKSRDHNVWFCVPTINRN